MSKNLYSTAEAAKILRLSRIEVFRKIRAGKIQAEKIGRNYVIPHESLVELLGQTIGPRRKEKIEKAVDQALAEYGETFRKLSKE